nr:hypothetical protein [Deltaproteobacteria bacterium]
MAALLLLSLVGCGSSRGVDFSLDASASTDAPTVAEVGAPDVSSDDAAPVDAPVAVDVPAPDDAPPVIDAASPEDAPTAVDAPSDAPMVDVPSVDAPDAGRDGGLSCRSSRDCGALGFVCDTARMTCVECLTEVDCTGGQVCGPDSVCRAPRCTVGPATCTAEGRVRTCDPRTGFVEMVCPAGMGCIGGRCQTRACTPGAVECGAGAERRTCSADGSSQTITACPAAPNAVGRCSGAGSCSIVCNPGFADCNNNTADGCEVDARSSVAHCGACGRACTAGLVCVAGACTSGACAAVLTSCSGVCRDLTSDPANCGGCGRSCGAGMACAAGSCVCTGGLTSCGGRCVNLQSDLANCGGCGVACGTSCTAGLCAGSTLTCSGSTYDVNGLTSDGCEAVDDSVAGHTQATASSRPSQGCSDTTLGTINGVRIPSDARPHSPAPQGFVATVGAAPDWYSVRATGGSFCANNYGVTVVTSGGSSEGSCYVVTLITDRTTVSMAVSGSGSNTMSSAAFGLYTENTTVYLRVEKVCSLPLRENVEYTLSYHL